MKVKNILIIFMLNYLVMLLVCCFIELMFISNNAQQVQMLVTTAADMALEQVQAVDDFFTSGNGYLLTNTEGLDNPYKVKVINKSNSKFIETNIFEAYAGTNDFEEIYKKVYNYSGTNGIRDFIKNAHGDISDITFLAMDYNVLETPSVNNMETNIRLEYDWYRVPVLAQLGAKDIYDTDTLIKKIYDLSYNEIHDENVVSHLWQSYDLLQPKREIWVNGEKSRYYLTPLSLGVTYINEELVQVLFMNNLDLLMRSKYGDNDLTKSEFGNGVLKTSVYSDLVDTDTLKSVNPINNGSFTLLRGEALDLEGLGNSINLYKGIAPEIEYYVVDMYDSKYDEILQAVLGPKLSNEVSNGSTNTKVLSGDALKRNDSATIDYLTTMTGSNIGTERYLFEKKPFVVAKVTFKAEFIIPYNTPMVREMRGRIRKGEEISGRTIFNAFEYSSINIGSINPIQGNYVDIDTDRGTSKKSVLGSNSVPFSYTTYFAVTP